MHKAESKQQPSLPRRWSEGIISRHFLSFSYHEKQGLQQANKMDLLSYSRHLGSFLLIVIVTSTTEKFTFKLSGIKFRHIAPCSFEYNCKRLIMVCPFHMVKSGKDILNMVGKQSQCYSKRAETEEMMNYQMKEIPLVYKDHELEASLCYIIRLWLNNMGYAQTVRRIFKTKMAFCKTLTTQTESELQFHCHRTNLCRAQVLKQK